MKVINKKVHSYLHLILSENKAKTLYNCHQKNKSPQEKVSDIKQHSTSLENILISASHKSI